jgi:prolyl-tRNA synthetase
VSVPSKVEDPGTVPAVEKFPTPGVRTIDDLSRFDAQAKPERQVKTLVYVVEDVPTLFLLRGDHELNEVKVAEATGTTTYRPATPEECRKALGALPGSLGAVGVKELEVYADDALNGRRGMVTGANEDDFHVRNVDVARDLPQVKWASLRNVIAGDACRKCGSPRAQEDDRARPHLQAGASVFGVDEAPVLERAGKGDLRRDGLCTESASSAQARSSRPITTRTASPGRGRSPHFKSW